MHKQSVHEGKNIHVMYVIILRFYKVSLNPEFSGGGEISPPHSCKVSTLLFCNYNWIKLVCKFIFMYLHKVFLRNFSENHSKFEHELLSSQTTHWNELILYWKILFWGFQKVQNHFCVWAEQFAIEIDQFYRNFKNHYF